jgi:GDPmannose 4,6-dehydratase
MTKKKIKSAFITGMPGMDASHLADYLLNLGYLVYGFIRRSSNRNYENI